MIYRKSNLLWQIKFFVVALIINFVSAEIALAAAKAEVTKDAKAETQVALENKAQKIITSHAIAMHGNIKYPADFTHFEYTSTKALKGGTLRKAAAVMASYDSFNPFITRGAPASDVTLIYETLMTSALDEPATMYGLVAERIEYPEDRSWVIFHINPKARFHDGKAISADDVVFSFNILKEKGAPAYAYAFADVVNAEALDKLRVKFTFKNAENRELVLTLGQVAVLPAHFWKGKEFDKTTLEKPLGSGPYRVQSFDAGRTVTYERVTDYWGNHLPVNAGMYNFDHIQVDYYRDDTVAVEALKAGQYDFRAENVSRTWNTAYDSPAVKRGDLVKLEIPDLSPRGMQAFFMNLRRSPFDNMQFRQAMNYAFDYEWANKNLFFDSYTRLNSYFFNSELAAVGLPEGRELEILTPFKSQLPESVFSMPFVNPKTDGTGNSRDNLKKAQQLLNDAGFKIIDGKLTDPKTKKAVTVEFLEYSQSLERIVNPYIQNLKRLGIESNFRMVDTSQYMNRLRDFDFDITTSATIGVNSPGFEQRNYWMSSAADTKGSENYAGVKNPVVDQLVGLIMSAPDRAELVARTRALDRVLLHNHYVVPHWSNVKHRLIVWDKFGRPEISPANDLNTFAASILTWWIDPEKTKRFQNQQNNKTN